MKWAPLGGRVIAGRGVGGVRRPFVGDVAPWAPAIFIT